MESLDPPSALSVNDRNLARQFWDFFRHAQTVEEIDVARGALKSAPDEARLAVLAAYIEFERSGKDMLSETNPFAG